MEGLRFGQRVFAILFRFLVKVLKNRLNFSTFPLSEMSAKESDPANFPAEHALAMHRMFEKPQNSAKSAYLRPIHEVAANPAGDSRFDEDQPVLVSIRQPAPFNCTTLLTHARESEGLQYPRPTMVDAGLPGAALGRQAFTAW